MKYLILFLMFLVLYFLASASFYLLRARDSKKMVKALTWRIGLSVLIFALLFFGAFLGWWHPHGLLAVPESVIPPP